MAGSKLPTERSSSAEIGAFLEAASQVPALSQIKGRLIFAPGCGAVLFSDVWGELGPRVFSFDPGGATDAGRDTGARHDGRVQCIQASIYALPLRRGDLFVFCSDGIFETTDETGLEFGSRRTCEIVRGQQHEPARAIVDAIYGLVSEGTDLMVIASEEGMRIMAFKHDPSAPNAAAESTVPIDSGDDRLLATLRDLAGQFESRPIALES